MPFFLLATSPPGRQLPVSNHSTFFLPQSYSWLIRFGLLVLRGHSRIYFRSLCAAPFAFLVFLWRNFFFSLAGVRERHYFCNQTQLTAVLIVLSAKGGVGEDQGESLRRFPTAPATSALELCGEASAPAAVGYSCQNRVTESVFSCIVSCAGRSHRRLEVFDQEVGSV